MIPLYFGEVAMWKLLVYAPSAEMDITVVIIFMM